MLVFDAFIFFNEMELLDIRLNVMDKYVDYFVIVESNKTFTLKDKPYNFEENKHLFEKFKHKIIYFKITFDGSGSAWGYEFQQRNAIKDALIGAGANSEDLVFISDLDEIPNLETFNLSAVRDNIVAFNMQYYYYYLNNMMNETQYIIKCCKFKHFATMQAQDIRAFQTPYKCVNVGWHFSYLGGAEKIKYKIESFSHQEMNLEKFTKNIADKVEQGVDLFDRGNKFEVVEIDESFPSYIVDNKDKFKHLIK